MELQIFFRKRWETHGYLHVQRYKLVVFRASICGRNQDFYQDSLCLIKQKKIAAIFHLVFSDLMASKCPVGCLIFPQEEWSCLYMLDC